jgi:hypothetical protein
LHFCFADNPSRHFHNNKRQMNNRIGRATLVAVLLGTLAIGAYWYWSPFLAMRDMQAAAKAKDADTFNTHVDYPRVRDSLKGQLSARMTAEMANRGGSKHAFEALGAMLGMAMVDKMVDAMVRPEVVMRGMENGKFGVRHSSDAGATATTEDTKWVFVRQSADKLIAFPEGATGANEEQVSIVFERSGFANWKVTELRMPALTPKAGT